ncbi:hypothetical protein ACIBXA_31720 [Micromonospora echinaurantiaca]|uniref:hypothetical protein n=1 Tax=Micromonospora echinaurantiaca TaxID=47857 RepID=UPI0037BDA5B8
MLDWFRRGWHHDDPYEWINSELGGDVYGLASIFEEARKQNLPQPQSIDELRELLHKHLWVEGDDDFIRLGEHALRVRTDDDEVDLAYYFSTTKPPPRHPTGLRSCCTTPGRYPSTPPRPARASAMAYRPIPSG